MTQLVADHGRLWLLDDDGVLWLGQPRIEVTAVHVTWRKAEQEFAKDE